MYQLSIGEPSSESSVVIWVVRRIIREHSYRDAIPTALSFMADQIQKDLQRSRTRRLSPESKRWRLESIPKGESLQLDKYIPYLHFGLDIPLNVLFISKPMNTLLGTYPATPELLESLFHQDCPFATRFTLGEGGRMLTVFAKPKHQDALKKHLSDLE